MPRTAAPTGSTGCRSAFPPASTWRWWEAGTAARTTSRTCWRAWSFRAAGASPWPATNFADVHQAVPGRRIAYATQNAYIFSGSLSHNLYYGLMHQPLRPASYDEAQAKREQTRVRDALIAGNSPDDVRADWIDYEAAGVADADGADRSRARACCARVEMEQEVIGFGLASASRPAGPPGGRGDGAGGAGAHPGPRAARGPGVVRRAVRSVALSLEHQRRRESAVRHAAQPRVPARQPARQSASSSRCCARSGCWTTSTRPA